MKTRDTGGAQHLQMKLRVDMLSTAIGFLLRLMDNSTGNEQHTMTTILYDVLCACFVVFLSFSML
jgi:hypothetical protein